MAYTDTEVRLINVPLDIENNHTYYFDSLESQYNFFLSKVVKSYVNLTYQRKEQVIYVPDHVDSINTANYVMYKNPSYSSKTYYAFIKEFRYINDECTEIIIQTDPIQTYLFDYTLGHCFIERQHVDDDRVGIHTIPEGLETGEYVVNSYQKDARLESYVYLLLVTEWPGGTSYAKAGATNFGGIPAGYGAMIFADYETLSEQVDLYDSDGRGDAIVGAIMIPASIVDFNIESGKWYQDKTEPSTYTYEVNKPGDYKGYIPKNNKLLTYPYQYLVLSNNAGSSNILQFEHFSDSEKCTFEVNGIVTFGGSIKCTPTNYKGTAKNHDEGIMCGKFPTLSWSKDLFTNWLTQNAVNLNIGTASQIGSIIAGGVMLATGAGAGVGAGLIASGVMGAAKQMGTIYEHSLTPDSAKGNVNGGDINTAAKTNTFHYFSMCIKKEYAEVIDRYFSMYGYKVNIIDIPLKNHRKNWWYTKCVDANVSGAIPQNERQKIIDCYNKGITFWKSTATFRSYEQNNDIV